MLVHTTKSAPIRDAWLLAWPCHLARRLQRAIQPSAITASETTAGGTRRASPARAHGGRLPERRHQQSSV
jgi:hypothetical protein